MVNIVGETRGGDQLVLSKISFSITCCMIIYLLRRLNLSTGPTLRPVSLLLMTTPLMLVLSLLLVLYSATNIKSAFAPALIYLLGVPLALIVEQLVHYILSLGYDLVKDPAFTRYCSVRESLMLSNYAHTLAHLCFTPLHVGYVALFLPLTLENTVIHVVNAGVKTTQRWEHLLRIGVCRFGTTLLSTLATGRLLVLYVGALPPRFLLLIAMVVAEAAYFVLPFFF